MVGNTLKISDTVKHNGQAVAVFQRKIFLIQLDQIGSQFVLIAVNLCFNLFHTESCLLLEIIQQAKRKVQSGFGLLCHFPGSCFALLNSNTRIAEKTGFQDHKLLIFCGNNFLLFCITDSCTCHFYKHISKWKKYKCCNDVKGTVDHCDAGRTCHFFNEREM